MITYSPFRINGYYSLSAALFFLVLTLFFSCGDNGAAESEQPASSPSTAQSLVDLEEGEGEVVAEAAPPPVKIKNPEAWNQLIEDYGPPEQRYEAANQIREPQMYPPGQEPPPVRIPYKDLTLGDFLGDLIKLNLFFKHPDKFVPSPQGINKKYADSYTAKALGYPIVREHYATEGPFFVAAPNILYFRPITTLPDPATVPANQPLLKRQKVYQALLRNDRYQPIFIDPVYQKIHPFWDDTKVSLQRTFNRILQKRANLYFAEADAEKEEVRQASERQLNLLPEEYEKVIAEIQETPLPADLSSRYFKEISPNFVSVQSRFKQEAAAFNTIYLANQASLDPREKEMVETLLTGIRQVEQAMDNYVTAMNAIEKPYTYGSLTEAFVALQLLRQEEYAKYKNSATTILAERKNYYYTEVTKSRN